MMYSRCLMCDQIINKYSLYSLFVEDSKLCINCESKLKRKHIIFDKDGIKIEIFYIYDSLFKDILLQYKECFDEALKDVFLYRIKDYLKIKYRNYDIVYALSTKAKLNERGFNHLKLIFESLGLKEIDGLSLVNEESQMDKNFLERRKMSNNYIYNGPALKNVLIVDDVYTTGSTIDGIIKVLRPYSKKISVVILAK